MNNSDNDRNKIKENYEKMRQNQKKGIKISKKKERRISLTEKELKKILGVSVLSTALITGALGGGLSLYTYFQGHSDGQYAKELSIGSEYIVQDAKETIPESVYNGFFVAYGNGGSRPLYYFSNGLTHGKIKNENEYIQEIYEEIESYGYSADETAIIMDNLKEVGISIYKVEGTTSSGRKDAKEAAYEQKMLGEKLHEEKGRSK